MPELVFTPMLDWARPGLDDKNFARWPFLEAQAALRSAPSGVSYIAACGWHGTSVDPELGSFVVVDSLGPLADLVGDRLKMTYLDNSVIGYCHTAADLLDDLSLTRRLFCELGSLGCSSFDDVEVEVLA